MEFQLESPTTWPGVLSLSKLTDAWLATWYEEEDLIFLWGVAWETACL